MRRFATLLLAPVLVGGLLSGCGGSPAKPAADKSLPTITGHYGDKPKIKIAKGVKPSKKLVWKVLKKGTGPKVVKGDLLVADYLGSIYKTGKVFDNSYDRKAPAAFSIGVGKVVAGWDKTLVGVNIGSRVEMVLPPKDGYKSKGLAQAGIKGTDSLIFVVDVIARYGKDLKTAAAPTPVATLPKGQPTVTGAWGSEPKVAVVKGTKPPTQPLATVLATGSGPKVAKENLVVSQYVLVGWDGKALASTWAVGPQGLPPNVSDLLIGTPIGSRVLLTLPSPQGGVPAKDSEIAVIDIIGQNGTAKAASGS